MSSPTLPSTSTYVLPSLRAFLEEIVDYAGLFPPAGLSLDHAIRNFARYRTQEEEWMLARFVIPVARLIDLEAHDDLFEAAPPTRFSVLGTGGDTPDAFLAHLETDFEAIATFHKRHAGQVAADVMEVRLPAALLMSPASSPAFLNRVQEAVEQSPFDLALFFEAPLDKDFRRTIPAVLENLATHYGARASGTAVGLKMRTGGLEPDAFPSSEQLAFALAASRTAGVRFKATAGLHHPVRHFNDGVNATMHGFFNVFGAATLAFAHDLDEGTIREILEEEDPATFHFTPDAFAWRTLEVDAATLRLARNAFAISFGSCSFEEPLEDLRALSLL